MFASAVGEGPFVGVPGEPWGPCDVAAGPGEAAPRLGELPVSGFAALELDWATAEPGVVSDVDVVDGIVGLDGVVSWAQARQARLLAEFSARRGDIPEAVNESRPTRRPGRRAPPF